MGGSKRGDCCYVPQVVNGGVLSEGKARQKEKGCC